MTFSRRFAITAVMFCFSLNALAASIPNETGWAKGTKWKYKKPFLGFPAAWVYTPTSHSKVAGKRGLIFHLMGCGQVIHQIAQGAGWGPAADAHGMVVVVPKMVAPIKPNPFATNIECFNYGANGMAPKNSPDQLAVIKAAKAMVADATLKIDANQVYIAGLSAGGTLALEIACMAPDVFTGAITAAAAGLGSNQSTAIMPPTINASTAANLRQSYMAGSPKGNEIKNNVFVLISDDNGLPACSWPNMPMCINNFNDQTVWDGDKFCPHAYNHINTEAIASVMGLKKSETEKSLGLTGKGLGCTGGEKASGDKGYVKCKIAAAKLRTWTAKADTYKDAKGRVRILRIEQDTLRHAWPTGTKDVDKITPSRKKIIAQGYMSANGAWNVSKVNGAPNGVLGVIYFNANTINLADLALKHFAANNPRIKPGAGPGPGPGPGPGDPCATVTCAQGETCDPATATCTCSFASCPAPLVCDGVTMRCIDPSNPGWTPPGTDADGGGGSGQSASNDEEEDNMTGCALSGAGRPTHLALLVLLLGVIWIGRRRR